MQKLMQQARDALANAVALARLVLLDSDNPELRESAEYVEREADDVVSRIDAAEDRATETN